MFLLDTNVVSELRKVKAGKADKNVAKWSISVDANDLFISVITLQEIELGILLMEKKDATQGALLRKWFVDHVIPTFAERTLVVDAAIAKKCAEINAESIRPYRDGFIAATALVHRMTLVTRDVGDFEGTSVALLNPWGT
ncbi:MAG: type II toxin-antitoxin system VapC family toxin [Burkholderiales bacterium]|nr:MAG: type II toxin-antitoxin system VapC family toxin [Burkholderiales bacterium]